MSITTGKTDPVTGGLRWATVDTDPSDAVPPGYDNPDLQGLPIGIYEALGELCGNDGQTCSTPECEKPVGPEHMLNDAGIPTSSRWHAVTLLMRSTTTFDTTNPVLLCEECGYPTLYAITGKAPW